MPRETRFHWPEYFCEAACLALFLLSACAFGVLLEHPASSLNRALPCPAVRRALMGLAMGLTAVALIHSPWGQRSGAHMNPAVTLAYWSLGRVRTLDAVFYVAAQFAGGVAGVRAAALVLGAPLADSAVNYVVTAPGPWGEFTALAAEFAISLILMATVLAFANTPRLARFTPWAAGALVAAYIAVEAPYSGMSMNPARTLGSALAAEDFRSLWIYFAAPPAAMFAAAQLFRGVHGAHRVYCAKLHHHNRHRCIFRCRWDEMDSQ